MVFCFQQNIVVYIFACLLLVVFCFPAKYPFLKWCFALQQKHHTHISCLQWCFAFQQNILAHAFSSFALYMLACLSLVVFCFSVKYPFFKWCFAFQQKHHIYMHISCLQWCFAFSKSIISICIFLACNGVLLFSKTFLLMRLVVSRFTSLLVCCLYVVFCFSAKYPCSFSGFMLLRSVI